jgi:hypothetical protein
VNVIIDSGSVTVADGGGSLTVDGTVTITDGAGAVNVICDSGCSGGSQYTEDAPAAADPTGNAVILVRDDGLAGLTSADGDNVAQRGTNFGAAYVTIAAADGTVPADDADGAPSTAKPVYVGGLATATIVGDTPAADNNRIGFVGGLDRVQIVRPHANIEDVVRGSAAVTDGSSTSMVAAQGVGVRFCATAIMVSNSSATNVTVDIRDGTAGSVILPAVPAAANMGGAVLPLATPLCTSANTAMAADPSASASTVTAWAIGFKTEL